MSEENKNSVSSQVDADEKASSASSKKVVELSEQDLDNVSGGLLRSGEAKPPRLQQ